MSGMGDGYVGTAQDAVRIRRLEKQREAERRKIQELKAKTASAKGQPGLLQFGSSTSEVLIRFQFYCFFPFFNPLYIFFFSSQFWRSRFKNLYGFLKILFLVYQILETAFKKETVGLVTREEYVEKV